MMRSAILLILMSSIAYGEMGLSVEPGSLLIQHVTLDRTYDFYHDLHVPLIIRHKGDSPRTYCLSTHKPSEVGNLVGGYTDIFDPSWLWFDRNEVTIPANGSETVQMYLRVPKEERFYNQHWTVAIRVEAKSEPGEMLALAVVSRIHLETEIKEGIAGVPAGLTGFDPARVKLGEKEGRVRIFNNDRKRHRYQFQVVVPSRDARGEQVSLSPGFNWLPDTSWIRVNHQRIRIGPGKAREIMLRFSPPAEGVRTWEALLMVRSEEGTDGFVRVQVGE